MRPDEDDPAHDGSMGRPLPGSRGPGDRRRAAGAPGDRSRPSSATTSASSRSSGEWWATGDHVRQDEDGYLWFEGRDDDIIITAGYRVGPFEVESALVSHPAVAEAAAVPAPDEERGSVVRAIVVLADGEPSDELAGELQDHVKGVTAPYKYPRIVEFADELPKTPSGKIRRAELRAMRLKRSATAAGPHSRGIFIVTNLGLLAVGATLAVLPHYVKDNLNGSDLEVGIVTGAFAFTGIVCRPIAGNIADTPGPQADRDRRGAARRRRRGLSTSCRPGSRA